MSHRYLNLRQTAEAIGVSLSWLRRHLRQLEQDHDFPKAITGLGTRRDAAAVDEWCRLGLLASARRSLVATFSAGDLALWREEMDRRATALAQRDRHDKAIASKHGKEIVGLRLVSGDRDRRTASRTR